jgi:hypothetical protein
VTHDDLAALVAERSIRSVVLRYCRGADRLDRELVRSCYHPDATDEHGSFSGGVDEFLEWVFRVLGRYGTTMHFVGNLLVELSPDDPDLARCETYGIAFHRSAGEDPRGNLMTGFRYVDRFERRSGEWRIARRIAVSEWSRVDDRTHWWPIPDGMRTGRRDRTDPVYDW